MQKYDYFLNPDRISDKDEVTLYNVGFSQCPPNYTYGWDTRNYYLIHYCISGKGIYYANGKEYSIKPHDGFLITPDSTIMHLADRHEPWNLCWVGFNGKRIGEYLSQAHLDNNNPIFRYTKDDFLENCIADLYDKVRIPEVSNLTLTSHLYALLGALIDNNMQEKLTKISLNHFEKAARYIKHNLRSPLTVELLALEHDIAPSQLYRSFMSNCGISPKQYINQQKMKKACELMAKTDLSFRDIAGYLGYEYETHFYKTFKKIIGIRPSEYKRKLIEEKSQNAVSQNQTNTKNRTVH